MERLIEEVRVRPAIWDHTIEDYRDAVLKDKGWDEIAAVLGKEKWTLRNKWKKIRDCHRQALVRRKTRPDQARHIKKWKYEDQMEFLKKTIRRRPVPLIDEIEEVQELGSIEKNQDEDISVQTVEDSDDDISMIPDDSEAQGKQRKEKRTQRPRGIDTFLEFMAHTKNNNALDDLDLFFASVLQSVRRLPRPSQNKVKMEVLNIICKAEEECDFDPASNNLPIKTIVPSPSPAEPSVTFCNPSSSFTPTFKFS